MKQTQPLLSVLFNVFTYDGIKILGVGVRDHFLWRNVLLGITLYAEDEPILVDSKRHLKGTKQFSTYLKIMNVIYQQPN